MVASTKAVHISKNHSHASGRELKATVSLIHSDIREITWSKGHDLPYACQRFFNGCNVAKTSCRTGHLTFSKTSQLAGCWWIGVSRQQDINSVQGDRLQAVSKSVCTVKISKFIHFQSKNNMKWTFVLTVVITSHILVTNEIHNWLNHVFMSLLLPLAELADNESETDGHLTRMGPPLIMNTCLIFPDTVFSQCKVANSELWLYSHRCAQLSYCFETSSRQVFHCGGKQCSI